jgi:hypothetical protein
LFQTGKKEEDKSLGINHTIKQSMNQSIGKETPISIDHAKIYPTLFFQTTPLPSKVGLHRGKKHLHILS